MDMMSSTLAWLTRKALQLRPAPPFEALIAAVIISDAARRSSRSTGAKNVRNGIGKS